MDVDKRVEEFNVLVERYDNERYRRDEISDEAREKLADFLEAGVDLSWLITLLGGRGVFLGYETLKEHNVTINLIWVAKDLSDGFVWKNLERFVELGADADVMLSDTEVISDRFFEWEYINSADAAKRLFELGVSPHTILRRLGGYTSLTAYGMAVLEEFLDVFVLKGYKEEVKEWLKKQLEGDEDMVWDALRKEGFLEKFGLDSKDYRNSTTS